MHRKKINKTKEQPMEWEKKTRFIYLIGVMSKYVNTSYNSVQGKTIKFKKETQQPFFQNRYANGQQVNENVQHHSSSGKCK